MVYCPKHISRLEFLVNFVGREQEKLGFENQKGKLHRLNLKIIILDRIRLKTTV